MCSLISIFLDKNRKLKMNIRMFLNEHENFKIQSMNSVEESTKYVIKQKIM